MPYLKEIFERANIQSFREYLLHGDSINNYECEDFEERIKQAYHNCLDIIKFYDSTGEDSELFSVIMKSISEYEDIYTEIGLQAGMLFMRDILCQSNDMKLFHKKNNTQKSDNLNSMEEQKKNIYAYQNLSERLNLQSIGCYIKDGSQLNNVDKTSFADRQLQAESTLEKELTKILGEETLEKVFPLIINYAFINEQIQFSLGMKSGAKLALLLTGDFDYDY